MIKRHKFLIMSSILLLILLSVVLNVRLNISDIKQQYIIEAKEYLENKYLWEMNIKDEVIIGDEKSVQAYPVEIPEIVFFVRKGEEISDTFLLESLRYEVLNILKEVFSEYDAEIYVSELKWCNPTPDGKNETFIYLDNLYYQLGRIPIWKDVNEYQRIECAKVNISVDIKDETVLYETVQKVQDSGCHIENLQITDKTGEIYEYSF